MTNLFFEADPGTEEPGSDECGRPAHDVNRAAAGDVYDAHLPEPAVVAVDPVRGEAVDDEAQRGEHAVGTHVAPMMYSRHQSGESVDR